jgi:hypothetical protein
LTPKAFARRGGQAEQAAIQAFHFSLFTDHRSPITDHRSLITDH